MKALISLLQLAVVVFIIWLVWSLFFRSNNVSTNTTVNTVSTETAVNRALDSLKTDTVQYLLISLDAPIEGKTELEIQGGFLGTVCPNVTLEGRVVSNHSFAYNSGEVASGLKLTKSTDSEVMFDLELGVPKIINSVPRYHGSNGKREDGFTNWLGSWCHGTKGLEEQIGKMIDSLAMHNADAAYSRMYSAIAEPSNHQNFARIVFNYWKPVFDKMGLKATVNVTFNTAANAPADFLREVKAKTYKVTVSNRNGTTEVIPQ